MTGTWRPVISAPVRSFSTLYAGQVITVAQIQMEKFIN